RRIVGLFNEKDRMDGGKRMASNWEVILTPFLRNQMNVTSYYSHVPKTSIFKFCYAIRCQTCILRLKSVLQIQKFSKF
ncbi:MAG: hypothetical protein SGI94_05590, partial [Saprospiraceae bacterium]|nr:hypothetical protein [Saprospiraceae bacterium]